MAAKRKKSFDEIMSTAVPKLSRKEQKKLAEQEAQALQAEVIRQMRWDNARNNMLAPTVDQTLANPASNGWPAGVVAQRVVGIINTIADQMYPPPVKASVAEREHILGVENLAQEDQSQP